MTENETTEKTTESAAAVATAPVAQDARPQNKGRRDRRSPRGRSQNKERRSEFDQKIIGIRRVTRVMGGGRRFSFSVSMVLGDKKGRVGVGIGKASDTALAIEKAIRDAKKRMITVTRTKNNSIPHEVEAKYCASSVQIRPSKGRGLVAGSSVRTVLELAGITDITAKVLSRSKSPMNNARVAIKALKTLSEK